MVIGKVLVKRARHVPVIEGAKMRCREVSMCCPGRRTIIASFAQGHTPCMSGDVQEWTEQRGELRSC
ncbi:MAG: hypothetical protein QG584_1105 [Pseudomonadota bacterium]|nr:hypothetical protein [Pseudomonadota bacterium]MDQ5906385.1 hypothetical protein [Pseudomonadota bacterium]MDQ5915214.1 hypothetical protein [Pseudomonadota bacterium]MDQ5946083.1 hypothetical protein [Pseudomonadota bacterium]